MDASYHPAESPDRLPAESEQKHPGHPTPSNEAQGVVPRGRVAGCHPQRSPHVKTQWLNEDESVGLWLTSSWGAGSFLPQAPAFPRGTPSRDPPQGPPGLHGTVESTQGGRWFPTRVSGFTDHEAALAMGEATEGGFLKLLSGPASAVGLLCGLNSAES